MCTQKSRCPRFRRYWKYLCISLFALDYSLAADIHEKPSEDIIIRGERPSQSIDTGPSSATIFLPRSPSSSDFSSSLQTLPSVQTQRSVIQSQGGFSPFALRGNDERSLEIFIDNLKIHDPATSLPIFAVLDSRMFSSFFLYPGISPIRTTSTNPFGTLSFFTFSQKNSQQTAGIDAGEVVGRGHWTNVYAASPQTTAQIFAKSQSRNGRYRYHNDRGTPFKSDDDTTSIRQDNQSNSILGFLRAEHDLGQIKFAAWGFGFSGEDGVPARASAQRTYAYTTQNQNFAHLNVSWQPQTIDSFLLGITKANAFHTQHQSSQALHDAKKIITPFDSRSLSQSKTSGLRSEHEFFDIQSVLEYSRSETKSSATLNTETIHSQQSYVGFSVPILKRLFVWEQKFDLRTNYKNSQQQNSTKGRSFRGATSALGVYPGELFSVILQGAYSERIPSLFQILGDGGTIESNPDLKREALRHYSLRVQLKSSSSTYIAVEQFMDQIEDQIVTVPSALPNTWKAQNLSRSKTKGFEVQAASNVSRYWKTSLGYLRANTAQQDLNHSDWRKVPHRPQTRLVLKNSTNLGLKSGVTVQHIARYASEIYLDTTNTKSQPSAWIHDASIEFNSPLNASSPPKQVWLSLNIDNIANSTKASIESSSGESGQTAISERWGYPLPGRSYRFSLQLDF